MTDFVDKDAHAVKLLGLYDNRSVRLFCVGLQHLVAHEIRLYIDTR